MLVAPARAYQAEDASPRRLWALAVQLYGVRSRRNWGHGDFTDLAALIDLAADLGAAGIGLNPLHAPFDELAEASPYSPNSRLFLNWRYIDVEAIAEFPGLVATSSICYLWDCLFEALFRSWEHIPDCTGMMAAIRSVNGSGSPGKEYLRISFIHRWTMKYRYRPG